MVVNGKTKQFLFTLLISFGLLELQTCSQRIYLSFGCDDPRIHISHNDEFKKLAGQEADVLIFDDKHILFRMVAALQGGPFLQLDTGFRFFIALSIESEEDFQIDFQEIELTDDSGRLLQLEKTGRLKGDKIYTQREIHTFYLEFYIDNLTYKDDNIDLPVLLKFPTLLIKSPGMDHMIEIPEIQIIQP